MHEGAVSRLFLQQLSGSLLMGSSIAYPILAQDGSNWAPVEALHMHCFIVWTIYRALVTFFVSGASFNVLQMSKILLYGHYTVIVCVVGVVLVVSFGHNTLADHVRLIPVYTMGSSFLTAAWPSLKDNWSNIQRNGYQHLPMHEASEYAARPTVSMSGIALDFQGHISPISPPPDWLMDRGRQTSSPSLGSPPPSREGEEPRPGQGLVAAWWHGLSDVRPVDHRSHPSTLAESSISLGSRQTLPSELSTNVHELLGRRESARTPRPTQRRRDIEDLGRAIVPREESSSSIRVADGSDASSTGSVREGVVQDGG